MSALEQSNTGVSTAPVAPSKGLIVSQPDKLVGLLDTINLMSTVSERLGESIGGDLGGGGSSGGTGSTGDGSTAATARDKAIAAIPTPQVMQKQLTQHIVHNMKSLRAEINKQTLKGNKPGSAYQVNESYKKMRRLQSFLSDLFSSTADVLKRIYIRVFVDKQPLTTGN